MRNVSFALIEVNFLFGACGLPHEWMNECFSSISVGACGQIIWNNISCSPLARHSFSNAHGGKTGQRWRSLWMEDSGPCFEVSLFWSYRVCDGELCGVRAHEYPVITHSILLWTSFFCISVNTGRIHHVRKLMCPISGAIVNYGAAHFEFRFPTQKPTSIKVKNLDVYVRMAHANQNREDKMGFCFRFWTPWPICVTGITGIGAQETLQFIPWEWWRDAGESLAVRMFSIFKFQFALAEFVPLSNQFLATDQLRHCIGHCPFIARTLHAFRPNAIAKWH